jgi:SulP family sulfate permease
VAAVAILITAAALTPLFYYLPEATLAAIVIHAVYKNISFRRISRYRHITRIDFYSAVVAVFGVLLLGLLAGLLLATFLALLVLLVGTKTRNTAVLGRVPGSTEYRALRNHPEGETFPGLLILRFDGGLFFANTPNFISAVRSAIAAAEPAPRVILIDGESMNSIDATAVASLRELQEEMARSGKEIRLARMKSEVMAVIERAELPKTIPERHIYSSVQAGVDAFLAEVNSGVEQKP